MVHLSQPTILATIMSTGVPTMTSAASATLPSHVMTSLVAPANCMVATTSQIRDGKSRHNQYSCIVVVFR